MKINDTKKHLCHYCESWQLYPECNGDNFEYGNGVGNDNIISCTGFIISDFVINLTESLTKLQ
jgi:hypothetical protein